jgi:hypothetical protein
MKISIEREGEFPVGWHHSHNHQCGNVGTPILRYRVQIDCDRACLNPDGWIIDNNALPGYFTKKYADVKDFVSCEHIAACAVQDFYKECRGVGSFPSYVKVWVSGIPGSWISAEGSPGYPPPKGR